MATPESAPKPGEPWQDRPPPLEQGDHLTRSEFERRYEAMPRLKKAELIEGVVCIPPPIHHSRLGGARPKLVTWIGVYCARTPHLETGCNGTVRLDLENEPQPDAVLFIDSAHGGQAVVSDDDFIEGAPELMADVSSGSVWFDLGTKLNAYRRNGVREYVVWRVLNREVDWFVLREGNYERLIPSVDGLLKSEVFPGLWLDVPALLRGDMAAVLATVQRGLATAEHAAFVERLALPRTGKSAQD